MGLSQMLKRSINQQVQENLPQTDESLDQSVCALDKDEFEIGNEYFKMGLPGSDERVFIRTEVLRRLRKVQEILPEGYRFLIFDGFRSMETQKAIFDHVVNKIMKEKGLNYQDAFDIACTFFTNPDKITQDHVPHNSGGAIDLALMYQGQALDMGTEFDETDEKSYTGFFEGPFDTKYQIDRQRWMKIRENRRLLVHSMSTQGFTNYECEWWHFDFGNIFWSKKLNRNIQFGECESRIKKLINDQNNSVM